MAYTIYVSGVLPSCVAYISYISGGLPSYLDLWPILSMYQESLPSCVAYTSYISGGLPSYLYVWPIPPTGQGWAAGQVEKPLTERYWPVASEVATGQV